MKELIRMLHEGNYSLVLANGEVAAFSGRGVSDLYKLLNENPGFLHGASLADKVIGKAAAALMIIGRVKEVYADVVSHPALCLFQQSDVVVSYTEKVAHIINRTHTGWCPLETRCHDLQTPEECLIRIREFLTTLGQP